MCKSARHYVGRFNNFYNFTSNKKHAKGLEQVCFSFIEIETRMYVAL